MCQRTDSVHGTDLVKGRTSFTKPSKSIDNIFLNKAKMDLSIGRCPITSAVHAISSISQSACHITSQLHKCISHYSFTSEFPIQSARTTSRVQCNKTTQNYSAFPTMRAASTSQAQCYRTRHSVRTFIYMHHMERAVPVDEPTPASRETSYLYVIGSSTKFALYQCL